MPPRNNLTKLKTSPKPAEGLRHFAVVLPTDVAEEYLSQVGAGASLETVLSDRLRKCVHHTAEKSLYFDDAKRAELDKLLNSNFKDAAQVVEKVRRFLTPVLMDVAGDPVEIVLNPEQLDRLKGRCFFGYSLKVKAKEAAMSGINTEIGMF